jgi:hypothetical protein
MGGDRQVRKTRPDLQAAENKSLSHGGAMKQKHRDLICHSVRNQWQSSRQEYK